MMNQKQGRSKALFTNLLIFLLATTLWAPSIHLFFRPDIAQYRNRDQIPIKARMLLARHLQIWSDPVFRQKELAKMQERNPEWDFMSRTYFVLALANIALADKTYKKQALEIIDTIINNTIGLEDQRGIHHFLMGYGRESAWVMQPVRSQFIDGEIALMLAARRFVEEKQAYQLLLRKRVEVMIERMRQSPVLCAESYPNECWIFCNTTALAAIRLADLLDGTDHSAFFTAWLDTARDRLLDPQTGMLISAFGVDGTPGPSGPGPEGTSIWMAAHMLQIISPKFAADQYMRARRHLFRTFLGFGYSREWPVNGESSPDVDSGPIVPLLGASTGASGLAFISAAGFHDQEMLQALLTSLQFAGFPEEKEQQLYYRASNPVGDAVLLYAVVEGPLWQAAQERIP